MQYKISCIIIAYNTATYIKDCLDSVFSQKLNSFEIIIIDNASTDDSAEIIKEYIKTKPNTKFIQNRENLGGSVAANLGITKAKGEYVFIIDSDDIVPQGTLKALYHSAKKHNSDIVIGRTKSIIDDTICNHKFRFYSVPFAYTGTYKSLKDCKELLILPFYWGRIYKTSFLMQNNILLPQNVVFADLYFNSLALKFAKNITICDHLSYLWRRFNKDDEHVSITSGKNQKKYFNDRIKSYIDLEEHFLDKNNRDLLYHIRVYNLVRLLVLAKYTAKSEAFAEKYCKKLYIFLKNIPFNDISDCPYLTAKRKILCYLLKQKRFEDFIELSKSKEAFETYQDENLEIIANKERFERVPTQFMQHFVSELNCEITNIKEDLFSYNFIFNIKMHPKSEYRILRAVLIDANGNEMFVSNISTNLKGKTFFKIPKKIFNSLSPSQYSISIEALVNGNFSDSLLKYENHELVISKRNNKILF